LSFFNKNKKHVKYNHRNEDSSFITLPNAGLFNLSIFLDFTREIEFHD
jgi:hypothetical protein